MTPQPSPNDRLLRGAQGRPGAALRIDRSPVQAGPVA